MRMLLLLLILVAISWAQAGEDKTQPDSTEQVGEPVRTLPEPRPPVRPLPFLPSQEIGADSHISFPTDI